MKSKYKHDRVLIFSHPGDREKGLDHGRLGLYSLSEGLIQIWRCTSGTVYKQGKDNFHNWGAMLPPNSRTLNAPKYEVLTKPIPLPHVKGVEGNFYKINPHVIKTDKGNKRSDVGIHLDANLPGSLGCLVMDRKNFLEFEKYMQRLRIKEDIDVLPLFSQYN